MNNRLYKHNVISSTGKKEQISGLLFFLIIKQTNDKMGGYVDL